MENKWQLCVCGVLRCDGEYLLIQRNLIDDSMAGFWEMPSGKMEFGEKAEESLIREIAEEIGINVTELDKIIIGISEYSSSENGITKHSVQFNYLINISTKDISIKLSREHIDYLWVKKTDEKVDNFISEIINNAEKISPSENMNQGLGL